MKRIASIDILRAFGIIFMVLGHIFTFFGIFDRYIHTFHMPLFFVISGYLYSQKQKIPVYSLLLQKAKRLLIPYLFYGVVNYFAWFFLARDEQKWYEPLINLVTYNTSGLPICGALWFLTALFWTEVFYIVIDRVLKKERLRTVFVLCISVLVSYLQNRTEYRLPLSIDIGIVCMGFYEIGHLYRTYEDKLAGKLKDSTMLKRFVIAMVLLLGNAVLAFVNPYVNVKSGWYGIVPLFWINAILGVGAYYLFSLLIEAQIKDSSFIKKSLLIIGKGSIIFMGFNQLAIFVAQKLLLHFSIEGNIWAISMAVFVVVMCVLYMLYTFIGKVKNKAVRQLFGI